MNPAANRDFRGRMPSTKLPWFPPYHKMQELTNPAANPDFRGRIPSTKFVACFSISPLYFLRITKQRCWITKIGNQLTLSCKYECRVGITLQCEYNAEQEITICGGLMVQRFQNCRQTKRATFWYERSVFWFLIILRIWFFCKLIQKYHNAPCRSKCIYKILQFYHW